MDSDKETTAAEGALRGITICGGFVDGPGARAAKTLAAGEIMVPPVGAALPAW
jgi:hypothetical protein